MAVVGTPSNLATLNAEGLRKIATDSRLKVDSVRPSIFTELKTIFQLNDMNEIIMTKPGIMLDVTNVGQAQQGQSVRLGLRTPLRKRAQYGTGEDMLGNEDETALYWTQAYYNEIKKAVKYYQWGYNFNDTSYLNYNEGYGPLLSLFMSELDDTRYHQAMLLHYSEELTYAPVSQVHQFNKNWAIPNLAESDYPAYDTTALERDDGVADADNYETEDLYGVGTFVENICAALTSAAGVGATSNAVLNVDNIAQIHQYVTNQHVIEPIMLDGMWTWVWTIPTRVKSWMLNPNNTGSLNNEMRSFVEYSEAKRPKLPGEIGRLYEDLLMVHDTRYCTLTLSGTTGSYNLRPGFLWPGNNDDRNQASWSNTSGSTNYAFDICHIMGVNALMKYTRDDLKSGLTELTEYGKIRGDAVYKGDGIQIPQFDLDAADRTADTPIYRGSLIVPVSRNEVNTIT